MSDIQSVYQTLTEVDRLLADIEVRIDKITGETAKGGGSGGGSGGSLGLSLQKQVRTLNMMMMLLQTMTGDANVDKAIQKIQQLTMSFMHLRMTMLAFQMAAGPVGWAYAGVTGIATAMSFGSMMIGIGE
jgi:multidrug transporter EmrE-like cation transporter